MRSERSNRLLLTAHCSRLTLWPVRTCHATLRRMKALLHAATALALLVPTIQAQTQASVGIGINAVRFSGGSSNSPSLTPAVQVSTSTLFAGLSGSVSSLPDGVWSTQGRAALWAATPPLTRRLRLGADGSLAGTTNSGSPATAAAHLLGELLWSAGRSGVGLGAGPSVGWIEAEPSITVLHTRARAWWRLQNLTWSASAEPTRFLGAWFTDLSAGVSLDRGRIVASAWGVARLSQTYGSRAAAGAFLQVYVTPHLALEAGGGSFLPDPYQGLPRARYLSGGIRLHTARKSFERADAPVLRPLTPAREGERLNLRFRLAGAHTVGLAGDWNDWRPMSLTPSGKDEWQGTLDLSPGTYHFVLVVDGTEWVVPKGVATVPDGMGGRTALMLVEPP